MKLLHWNRNDLSYSLFFCIAHLSKVNMADIHVVCVLRLPLQPRSRLASSALQTVSKSKLAEVLCRGRHLKDNVLYITT